LGFTVLPDWPTWRELGIQPWSTRGRETDRVAPILSASPSNCSRFSFSPTPRPTDMRKSAAVMSTSPLAAISWKSLCRAREPVIETSRAASKAAPSPSAGAQEVGRIMSSVRSWPGNSSSAFTFDP
jgi:hypothetical protein